MVTISKTGIANLALSHLRAKSTVENIETGTSTEAKQARLWYDQCREQVLSAMDWGFARKYLTLSSHSEDPSSDWGYRYQYPSDAVYFRRIQNPAGPSKPLVPFEIGFADSDGTKTILTDASEAIGIYTRNITDTSLFTPDFRLALSFLLAHFMAGVITGKETIKANMMTSYQTQIVIAGAQNFNEQADRPPAEAAWMRGSVR